MKKIASKVLIILIVLLLLFDFVFASQYRCVFAANGLEKGFLDTISDLSGGIVAIVYTLLKALIVGLTFAVQILTTITASAEGVNMDGKFFDSALSTVAYQITPITPIDIFFNKYKLLDINFFDFNGLDSDSFIYTFRMSVAGWYAIMKLIACAILLVILLYVGIKMSISTIADDKAKYKKMLADWVVSLLLIFILQYIMIFTVYCNNAIVNALEVAFADSGMSSAASDSIIKIGIQGIVQTGIISYASVLVYIFIVFQTIIFLIAYLKRMVKIGFLIIISPLISITYSIDKMGDGKAQALGNWLKEFVYTILIQPFHCIIYLALVQTAINLLKGQAVLSVFGIALLDSPEYNQLAAGALAIMCLKFVNEGEQVVRKIFGFKDDGSTGMGAAAALGVAAMMNAQKIGAKTRVGVNNLKAKGKKFGTAIRNDLRNNSGKYQAIADKINGSKLGKAVEKMNNTKVGKKATSAGNAIGDKIKSIGDEGKSLKNKVLKGKKSKGSKSSLRGKIKDSALGKAVIKGVNSNVGKYLKSKASLSTALGIMGAAMKYSAGSSGAMESIATGIAIQKGTQEFFGSSNKTVGDEVESLGEDSEKYSENELINSKINEEGNDFSEDAKKALDAYKTKDNAEKEINSEISEKKKQLANLNPDNKEDREKLEKEIEKLNEEKENIPYIIEEANEIIKKYDADGYLAGKRDANGELERDEDGNIKRYSDSKEDFDRWKSDAKKKFAREREQRFKGLMSAPDTKKLDALKEKIMAQLRSAMKNNKSGQDENNSLTVEEEETIASTAQLLMDNIALGTLSKKGFGTEAQKKIVAQQMGLDKDGTNMLFSGVSDFSRLTKQYEQYSRQSIIASNFSHVDSYDKTGMGIASDSLLNRILKQYNKKHEKTENEKTVEEG